MSLVIVLFPKNPRVPSVSHQEESEPNSQSGFPTEPTAQNAHIGKEKKWNFGMLWNP